MESDQPQFTVNQRYPVYFPELRPFFLENANYFATPINLLYTRNIVHPEYGFASPGKIDHTNLGLLAIDDREPGETVAPGDPLYHKHATFAVGRVSQDLGKGSSLGAMYTDEEFGQGWNRIGGIDFAARMNDKWTAQGQMVESSTMGDEDSGTPPTYSAGPASEFTAAQRPRLQHVRRTTRTSAPASRRQLGFIQTANIRSNHTHAKYQWFPKHSFFRASAWRQREHRVGPPGQSRLPLHHGRPVLAAAAQYRHCSARRRKTPTPLGPQNGYAAHRQQEFHRELRRLRLPRRALVPVELQPAAFRSGNVNYNPVAGQAPSLLNQETVQLLFTVQPVQPAHRRQHLPARS